jgi:hypothetical protein
MRIAQRIKKLEMKLIYEKEHMAVFNVTGLNDPEELALEKKKLVNEYIATGNPCPSRCVFINELP